MAAIEELSPSAGPVSTRPPEDEIDDDEDEDVSVCLFSHTVWLLNLLLDIPWCIKGGQYAV